MPILSAPPFLGSAAMAPRPPGRIAAPPRSAAAPMSPRRDRSGSGPGFNVVDMVTSRSRPLPRGAPIRCHDSGRGAGGSQRQSLPRPAALPTRATAVPERCAGEADDGLCGPIFVIYGELLESTLDIVGTTGRIP